jgi:hypothetical protein
MCSGRQRAPRLAGCDGSLSGSAHNGSEDAQAMDGHAFEDDARDGSPPDDDADASDAGDFEADAPAATVSLTHSSSAVWQANGPTFPQGASRLGEQYPPSPQSESMWQLAVTQTYDQN